MLAWEICRGHKLLPVLWNTRDQLFLPWHCQVNSWYCIVRDLSENVMLSRKPLQAKYPAQFWNCVWNHQYLDWEIMTALICHRQAQARRLWFSCLSWFWNLPNCCSHVMPQGRQNQPFPNQALRATYVYIDVEGDLKEKLRGPWLHLQHWRRSDKPFESQCRSK